MTIPDLASRRPLAPSAVTIDDAVWAPRRELIRTRTLRQQHEQLRRPGRHCDALRLTWRPATRSWEAVILGVAVEDMATWARCITDRRP